MRTILIGLGNPILSDDGVGLEVVRRFCQTPDLASRADTLELGAGGLRLMEAMVGYDQAIVVDAMETGSSVPGTVIEFSIDSVSTTRNISCSHDSSLGHAVSTGQALGLKLPRRMQILGIEAGDVETFSETLTPEVEQAVPLALTTIARFLEEWTTNP
ncbi:MAG: hydrogenase maturation protease [Candidatus Riflebacteria bacterium]|nr:hydrogenase maturation protease [Candidatus Riflebacteria bacterium]